MREGEIFKIIQIIIPYHLGPSRPILRDFTSKMAIFKVFGGTFSFFSPKMSIFHQKPLENLDITVGDSFFAEDCRATRCEQVSIALKNAEK